MAGLVGARNVGSSKGLPIAMVDRGSSTRRLPTAKWQCLSKNRVVCHGGCKVVAAGEGPGVRAIEGVGDVCTAATLRRSDLLIQNAMIR